MRMSKELIEEAVLTAPLSLLTLNDKDEIALANSYLSYSTGMEIECETKDTHNQDNFKIIPDIMSVDSNRYSGEQRFRIPIGIAGLICLYNLSETLKENCLFNPQSGIHYHTDLTNGFDEIILDLDKNKEWILSELDSWPDANDTRYRTCKVDYSGWVRFQSGFRTMEVRVGEMAFDYEVLVERILHCQKIARELKTRAGIIEHIDYPVVNREHIINYLEGKVTINTMERDELIRQIREANGHTPELDMTQLKQIIKKRVVKI